MTPHFHYVRQQITTYCTLSMLVIMMCSHTDLIYTDTDIRLSQPDETSDEAGVTDSCPSHLLPVPDPDNSAVTDHPTAITVMGDTGPGLDSGQTEDEDEDEDIYEDYDVRLKVEEPVDVDKLTTMQSSRSAQNVSAQTQLFSLMYETESERMLWCFVVLSV